MKGAQNYDQKSQRRRIGFEKITRRKKGQTEQKKNKTKLFFAFAEGKKSCFHCN
jgi:hypothetical protein